MAKSSVCCAGARRLGLVWLAMCIGAGSAPAYSGWAPDTLGVELGYAAAVETADGEHSLSRVSIVPEASWRFGRALRLETSLRLDVADDDTGLGDVAGYSKASRPWIDSNRVRLELDRAHLTWRSGSTRVRVGKQVTAWGVLDGLRITDRFDAVRRRDFVYTDVRPERIARWGLQARRDVGEWTVELSAAIDPTVSQQARLGDALAPRATRFTGGLDLSALGVTPALRTSGREAYGRDMTYGARTSRDIGAGRLSVLAFRGPATDPVLSLSAPLPAADIELRHPLRTLVGASFDYTLGATVVRAELAHIPDQPVNVFGATPLARTEQARWLAGVAVDVNAPFGVFVNAQLALDYMDQGEQTLVRPQTDLIGTVRAQRRFQQAGYRVQLEWLGSFSDGDGVLRPEVRREFNDTFSVALGADLAYGDREGLFGQFERRNRGWLRLQLTL